MKNTIKVHPEMILNTLNEAILISENTCKIIVMSVMCYARLLKEDKEKNNLCMMTDIYNIANKNLAMFRNIKVYVIKDEDKNNYDIKTYDINIYSKGCEELQIDNYEIWKHFKEINK